MLADCVGVPSIARTCHFCPWTYGGHLLRWRCGQLLLIQLVDCLQGGKYLKKKNTFTDLVVCAEHLIAEKYTSSNKLCIEARLIYPSD